MRVLSIYNLELLNICHRHGYHHLFPEIRQLSRYLCLCISWILHSWLFFFYSHHLFQVDIVLTCKWDWKYYIKKYRTIIDFHFIYYLDSQTIFRCNFLRIEGSHAFFVDLVSVAPWPQFSIVKIFFYFALSLSYNIIVWKGVSLLFFKNWYFCSKWNKEMFNPFWIPNRIDKHSIFVVTQN